MTQPDAAAGSRIFAIGQDGARTPVEGSGVVVAFGDGRELHVSFSSRSANDGGVMLRSEFFAPGSAPVPPPIGRAPDVLTSIVLHPGGGNLMKVGVEARARSDVSIVVAADAPASAFFVTNGDARTPLETATVVLDLGGRRELIASIAVGPPRDRSRPLPTRPGHVALLASAAMTKEESGLMAAGGAFASAGFWVCFGGSNVVHLVVQRQDSVRAIRTIDDAIDAALAQWRRVTDGHAHSRLLEFAGRVGPEVVEALLVRMSGDEPDVRAAAHDVLRRVTGEDFGFDPSASADERAAAFVRWRTWRSDAGERLVFDAAALRFVVR